MDDQEIVFLRELKEALKEFQLHNLCRRVMGKADDEELRLGPCLLDRLLQMSEEFFTRTHGDATEVSARKNHGVLMDRIGRAWTKDHVTGVHDGPDQMTQSLFCPDRDYGLRVGIDLDLKAPPIPVRNRKSKFVDTFGSRIAVIMAFFHCLNELGDKVRRCRLIRVAHAEIDDVFSSPSRLLLQVIDDVEDIRREPLDALEFHSFSSYWYRFNFYAIYPLRANDGLG